MKPNNSKNNKVNNRNIILKMMAQNAPISRVELARASGLSKMSLTNIITEFTEDKLVKEIGIDATSTGKRKPVLLDFVDNCILSIGINITRDYVEGCLADIKGNVVYSKRIEIEENAGNSDIEGYMTELITSILNIGKYNIVGIGISTIGPVDLKTGILYKPTDFQNIENFNIIKAVKEKFDLPVFMQKNNNCAILAEKYYGVCKDASNFSYIGVSRGVGAASVVNDMLITGESGYCCEIGHITIDYKGEQCSCGNRGCLERYANIRECVEYVKGKYPEIKNLTFNKVVNMAKEGNEIAIYAIDKLCGYIAIGIVNLVKIYDPTKIIIGSDIAIGGDVILDKIKEKVLGVIDFENIYISKFYDKGSLLGAATLVFENMFFTNI